MSFIVNEHISLEQEKGGPVELVVTGDEFYAIHETPDGYTAVYDQDRGMYCYAVLAEGSFVSTGSSIAKRPPRGIRRHLRETPEIRSGQLRGRYSQLRSPGALSPFAGNRTFGANAGLLPGRRVSEGEVRGLTILVEFADVRSTVSKDDVEEMLNADEYNRNGNHCSVKRYFETVSSGWLKYTNDVVGPITLGRDRNYYHSHSPIEEAIERAAAQNTIDLSRYDSRNAGFVDALNIMYAGRTQYVDGYLWPHNSAVNHTVRGKRFNLYMITSMGRQAIDLSIGTFCHENGHLLCRFPDLYDYGRRDNDADPSYGMGVYCLMSAGNHLNKGRTPAPVCAYLRYLANWYDAQTLLHT
ncbi:MAG: M6 family metalloprotease domain-containing protein, partial [Chitinivibrionales bacterium]|nr:M6 family metalloprotease domain-containing protein [Chitinivibrionales bacterium]MBD3356843.1 M6 family metalloprotease domain-containing protein [Chitinivibrionales bacterium]